MDFKGFGSMRRKQSSSLLQALSKSDASRVSAIPINAQTPPSLPPQSQSHSEESHGSQSNLYSPDDSYSSYSTNPTTSRTASSSKGGRSVSAATTSTSTFAGGQGSVREVKKLEDVIGLSKDRLLNWSYLMQWYGGDTHWLNTVKVRRELVEKELGPSKLDQRARQYFILGTSLAMLFDITVAGDFLRALSRLLDEWEYYCEKGGKAMKGGLFKTQKGKNKGDLMEAESYLVFLNLPFTPDFFSVHATTCSVIRDIYKKLMGMLLPSMKPPLPVGSAPPPRPMPNFPDSAPGQSLLHPSTFIFSAPTSSILHSNPHLSQSIAHFSCQEGNYDGGSVYSTPTAYHSTMDGNGNYSAGRNGRETPFGDSAAGFPPENGPVQHDAFEAFINGDLPPSHSLVGDGQQITPQIIETFVKVDARLKKQFNLLLKEGDQFARKTLDDEISMLLSSLTGSAPLQFDYNAAMSGVGNGWQPSPSSQSSYTPPPNTASTANFSISNSYASHGQGQGSQSLPRRHPGLTRQGSSGDSLGVFRQVRAGSNSSQGHGGLDDSIDEEVVMDEEGMEDERRERNFGTI